jgi:dUTP pyrophosphatase
MTNNMLLKIFIDSDDNDLIDTYTNHVVNHNIKRENDEPYEDAGFDIFVPSDTTFLANTTTKVISLIKCAAYINNRPCGFYVYPRSSISKTPLRLANQTGIIDAGYRGSLIGMFDNISIEDYNVKANTRLLQICAPSLQPIIVELVHSEDDLGMTNRGTGGFGSTGTGGFNSTGSMDAFTAFLNNQNNGIGYMDIARQMDSIFMNNFTGNESYMNDNTNIIDDLNNNMNITDEDIDTDVLDIQSVD